MKKVIKGSRYDTETAKEIGSVEPMGSDTRSFNYYCESLYRTKAGKYFLHGEGHANSRYGEWQGNTGGWGKTIRPYTFAEAREWAEENLTADAYEAEFGLPEEPDNMERLNTCITAESKFILERMQSQQNKPISLILDELIKKSAINDR